MDLDFDVSEITAMARNYANGQQIVTQELTKGVARGQKLIEDDARRMVPVDTGRLKNSIGMEPVVRIGDTLVGRVGTNVKYAPHVEFGTAPHVIYPKNKKALYWPGALHPVAYVNHPGTRKRPYLVPALHNNALRIRGLLMDAAMTAMKRIGGGR